MQIQQSLLDKLSSEKPGVDSPSSADHANAVMRDVTWLLNAVPLEASVDLNAFPEVRTSVLNFGWVELIGDFLDPERAPQVVNNLRHALDWFEPRVVSVASLRRVEGGDPGTAVFQIEGSLVAEPLPLELVIEASLDDLHGAATVTGQVRQRQVGDG